jgi:hypothetical protein
MSTHFKIDYSRWSTNDTSPINSDIKVKTSHAKLLANAEIAERNKDIKFREKVSKGVSKYFGTIEERFISKLKKVNNGCIEYPNRWIYNNKKAYQPKTYAAEYYKLGFTKEIVYQKCGNNKCVNPKHLVEMTREEQALHTVKIRKTNKGEKHHQSKLINKDIDNIKKLYNKLLKERDGKHKGIATIIQKKYQYVSLARICQIIKNIVP